MEKSHDKSHYGAYAINLLSSGVIMYLVMFTMIDGLDDFYHNVNMFYMTLMMVAPMAILMLLMMGSMYRNKKLNVGLYVAFAAIFLGAFFLIRSQTPVGNEQFLRSMIPHHSGAILMCRESSITDPELLTLCGQIIQAQKEEIAQMKAILARY